MKRRGILGAVSAVALWPHATRAQQAGLPVIGYLDSTTLDSFTSSRATAFRRGLEQAGFVEGRNMALEFARADGQYDRLPALAESFVRRPVAAILAASLPSALAAKAATATIPIVFVMGADPVALKIVDSLGRPGGNATGVSQFYGALGGKRLEILRELVPGSGLITILCNAKNPNTPLHLAELERAAGTLGQRIEVISASNVAEIDAAFATMMQYGATALLLADDPFFSQERAHLIALAARHALPTIYYMDAFPNAGGLISYGSDGRENFRLAGAYVGRILKGTRPADLPVLQPEKFELIVNLKTARALGLNMPPSLLARADEVIE